MKKAAIPKQSPSRLVPNVAKDVIVPNFQPPPPVPITISPARCTVNPLITPLAGPYTIGTVMTCSTGSWKGFRPITFGYQWRRNGVDIATATAATWTLTASDVAAGVVLTCQVIGTNADGSSAALSNKIQTGT